MKIGAGGLQSQTVFEMLRAMTQPNPERPAAVRPEKASDGTPAAVATVAAPPGEDLIRAVGTLNRAAEQHNYPYRLRVLPEQPGWLEVVENEGQQRVGVLNPGESQALVENVRHGELGMRTDLWV
jgi:hypothetical protein